MHASVCLRLFPNGVGYLKEGIRMSCDVKSAKLDSFAHGESYLMTDPKNGNYTLNAKYFADNFEQTITYGNPELFYSIQVSYGATYACIIGHCYADFIKQTERALIGSFVSNSS